MKSIPLYTRLMTFYNLCCCCFLFFFKNTLKQTTWTLRCRRSWSKADTGVDTTPSLPVKRKEIIRSRLSLVHRGGGRERGRIIQKLIISRIGFLCPLSVLAEPGCISLWLTVEIFNYTRLTDMHPSKAANRQVGELDSYCFYHIS